MATEIQDTLRRSLEEVREGYDAEIEWHRFLLDSYTGGGGYRGRIKQPSAGYWGWAATEYARAAAFRDLDDVDEGPTYLDSYSREDSEKFRARRNVAHYINYVRPLTDLKVGYLARKAPDRRNLDAKIEEWRKNVDGQGSTFDRLHRELATRAALLGWIPVLIDAPKVDQGLSAAQVSAENGGKAPAPRMIPLLPCNLLDYSVGESGALEMAKIRIDRVERPIWNAPPEYVSTFTIWTPTTFERHTMRRKGNAAEITIESEDAQPHQFGRVPVVVFRHAAHAEEKIKGEPMHGDVAIEARRLFNLLSEFDEHLRSQVFALLVVPTEDPKGLGELNLGTDNALPVHPQSSRGYEYLAPPASVAATYEARITATVQELYRMARVEWTRASAAATSAASRKTEFDATNMAIAAFAVALCDAERDVYRTVGPILTVSPDALEKIEIVAPEDFDVEALADDVETTIKALGIAAGTTYRERVLWRWVSRMLGNLSAEDAEAIREEIKTESRNHAASLEIMRTDPFGDAGKPGGEDGEDADDPKGKGGPPFGAKPGGPPKPGAKPNPFAGR